MAAQAQLKAMVARDRIAMVVNSELEWPWQLQAQDLAAMGKGIASPVENR